MTWDFVLDAPVPLYRRPLKVRDFVWEIKYWDLRTLNNVKSNFCLNEMNKKDLTAMYSTVFWRLLVVVLVFWLYCINTVTPFIRRSEGWSFRSGRVLDQSQQKCRFFAEIQIRCKVFQFQPSSYSLGDRLDKSFIISSSNRVICAGRQGTSGFRSVLVTTVALIN